jgi:hypothetical protein
LARRAAVSGYLAAGASVLRFFFAGIVETDRHRPTSKMFDEERVGLFGCAVLQWGGPASDGMSGIRG